VTGDSVMVPDGLSDWIPMKEFPAFIAVCKNLQFITESSARKDYSLEALVTQAVTPSFDSQAIPAGIQSWSNSTGTEKCRLSTMET
jgi:hypothetical protein